MSASKANIAKMREDISEKFDNVEQVTAKLNKTKQKLLEEEKALQQLKDKISPTIASSDH